MDQPRSANGFVTLIMVLILGALGLVISISLLTLGLTSSKSSFSLEQSAQTRALASACVEEALQQIRDENNFEGEGNLSMGQGNCTYTVVRPGGTARDVTATGTVGTIIRKVEINARRTGVQTFIDSWQEVADF